MWLVWFYGMKIQRDSCFKKNVIIEGLLFRKGIGCIEYKMRVRMSGQRVEENRFLV